MAYYRICQRCGAALDPGEICEDCRNEAAAKPQKIEGNAKRMQREKPHRTESEQREIAHRSKDEARAKHYRTPSEPRANHEKLPIEPRANQEKTQKNNRSRCYQHRERQSGK